MFSVFIDYNKAIDICKKGDSSDTWYSVLCKQRVLHVNSNAIFDDENPLFVFSLMHDQNLEDSSKYMESIIQDNSKVLENPCGAFILNIGEDQAKKIRKNYGVICESTQNLQPSILVTSDFLVDREKDGKTWERFPFKKTVPSNTLIIQDRFFCRSDYGESIEDSYENFKGIIHALMPLEFMGEYHLMLIFDAKKIETRDCVTFEDISYELNQIKEELERERGYTIIFEILSVPEHSYLYEKTHNRRIISNYYWIRADHKLKAFRGTENLAEQSLVSKFIYGNTTADYSRVFEDEEPDTPELNHEDWLRMFKEITRASIYSGQYSRYNNNTKFDPIVYDYTINDAIMPHGITIQNRLLS